MGYNGTRGPKRHLPALNMGEKTTRVEGGWREFSRDEVLGYLRDRATTYPDASRSLSAGEVAIGLGATEVDVRSVAAVLRQAARDGLCWRTPGPGAGQWINGPVATESRMEPREPAPKEQSHDKR